MRLLEEGSMLTCSERMINMEQRVTPVSSNMGKGHRGGCATVLRKSSYARGGMRPLFTLPSSPGGKG